MFDDVIKKFDAICDWLSGLYVNTLNVIHYMHDKYCYEKLQMALHDNEVFRTMACGVAGLSVVCDSLSAIRRTSFVYPGGCLAAMENPVLRSGFPTTARPFRAFKRLRVENAARLPHSDRRSRSTSSVFIYQMEGRRREAATPARREPPAGATWFALCGILREGKPL